MILHPYEIWTARAQEHEAAISPLTDAFVKRRSMQLKHPVHDFLFTYYSFSPLKLKQWVPSITEGLIVSDQMDDYPWLKTEKFCLTTLSENNQLLSLNRERIPQATCNLAKFVAVLCRNILQKAPHLNCYGLHEWAMVYKLSEKELRHKDYDLRIPQEALIHFVENQKICCTHYDAYRFFTKEASPLNCLTPTLDSRIHMEQAGCLHANMDLYKWGSKLWPWIGSDFIRKAFFLALEARELDMKASPYDLTREGYPPICIETKEGRKQYQKEQKLLMMRATSLRHELLEFCKRFLET